MVQTAMKEEAVRLPELCERVEKGERVVFAFGGKRFALIEAEDLEFFEALEDERDCRLIEEAMKEPGEIPFGEIKKKYGYSE